jgi:glycerol-3-phosphate O-acyltransferase
MGELDHWPAAAGEAVLLLVEALTPVERRVVDSWVANSRPHGTEVATEGVDAWSLAARLMAHRTGAGADPWVAPVRVVWLPPQHDGERTVRMRDVVRHLGDPRRPRPALQARILEGHPDRCRVVVAEPARLSDLRARWAGAGRASADGGSDGVEFARFVARQATLALERAESRMEGAHYKVPRLVREEILASPKFRSRLEQLAGELGRDPAEVAVEATGYLEEMVTGWTRLLIDLVVRMGRFNFERGYDAELDFDEGQVERLRAEAREHSLVFLPSHKSNLDSLVMNVALHDSGLPRTHIFGGINMAFWPMGPIFRRAGTIFIRRDTRGNPVYTFTLRQYVAYLIEKRFSLQFYVEGGRSRTGKLLPPRMGLLAYVADAYRQGASDDVLLVPVSIAYDQLQEVGEFAREARGATKSAESIGWLIRTFREQRGRYGRIYVRFAEPLSLREALGPPDGATVESDGDRLALQKVALEVSRRINEVTPITATSLVTLSLLGTQGRALTLAQVRAAVYDPLQYAVRRGLPLTRDMALDTDEGVQAVLQELERHRVVARFAEGIDPVYAIGPDQHLAAAFYRNSIIHFFVRGALAQAALARLCTVDVADPLATFWDTALATRDLLKHEFFFEPRDDFRTSVESELALYDPQWEKRVVEGPEGARDLLSELHPLTAHTVLRSFLEAYSVVAEALVHNGGQAIDERAFLSGCLALGRQHLLQQRIHSPESLSKPLFANALQLAKGRGLVEPSTDVQERQDLLDELRAAIRDLDVVELLATARVMELINS